MRKFFTFIFGLIVFTSNTKAQYVNIPDANFRAYLISQYPSCFNASQQMDTTCADILAVWDFNINEASTGGPVPLLNISSLEGLQYFKNLTTIRFIGQQISFVPNLDRLLNLDYFNCSYNQLTTLPDFFTDALYQLYCNHNMLTSLGSLELASMQEINCSYNNLDNLPEGLYANTATIDHNNINCLPWSFAPQFLQMDTSKIHCLPYMVTFELKDEYGNTLPHLDGGLGDVDYPLCNLTNNVNNCFIRGAVAGKVYNDNNNNGIKDVTEIYRRNIKVQLSTGETGYTNFDGSFRIYVNSAGTKTVNVISPAYFTVPPPAITVNAVSYDTVNIPDIPLQATISIDSLTLSVSPAWRFRPGNSAYYWVTYENTGTTTVSTNLVFNFNNTLLTYSGSSQAGIINNGNYLSFNETNFQPGQVRSFYINFLVSTLATSGTMINADAMLTGGSSIAHDTIRTTVFASYDPNDKIATASLTTIEVNSGKYIDYLVRFQNTGNDTAFNIVIADTLSDKLIPGSVQVTDASASCEVSQNDKYVFFKFSNIMLPDSNVNEPLSHGFVKFRVRAKTTLPSNDIIDNAANIYFDYNSAVLTNTAHTIVNNTTLPLSLLTFKGYIQADNTALLNWTTANELNTRSFEIEQSTDSRNFSYIRSVAAKGSGDNSYMQNVTLPAAITYYRLKMLDIDGKFAYSPVIKISVNKNASGIVLMGNPVQESLVINVTDKSIINTTAMIINSLGANVKTVFLKEGLQSIDVSNLAAGNYFIKTIKGSQKFMVSK